MLNGCTGRYTMSSDNSKELVRVKSVIKGRGVAIKTSCSIELLARGSEME